MSKSNFFIAICVVFCVGCSSSRETVATTEAPAAPTAAAQTPVKQKSAASPVSDAATPAGNRSMQQTKVRYDR